MNLLVLPFSVFQQGDEVAAKLSRQLPRMIGSEIENAIGARLKARYLSSRGTDITGRSGLVAATELPSPGDLETVTRMYGGDLVLTGRFGLTEREILIEGRYYDVKKKSEVYAKRFETYPTYYFDAVEEIKLRATQLLGIDLGEEERVALFSRPTESWQAYLYYLLAEDERYALTLGIPPQDHKGAITLYQEAINTDPSFIQAKRGLEHLLVLLLENDLISQTQLEVMIGQMSEFVTPEFTQAIDDLLH
ncbi:MAG TPA: hypothetical protein VFH43_12615 [Candidatus Kapabacteria bacterium]|nr:hypothetical protein [Candidatus Kapabacteria bacterium]